MKGHHQLNSQPYSIYTAGEKWFILAVAAFAAMFSPLTANIYFPAIPTMSKAFNKSTELINLTVTVYMVVQGVAPMLWGTLSDRWGRRPMFICCMIILSLSCVGLALVPTDAYWGLMLLRCLQAFGSASTVALGAGVIADIAAPFERGSFFGLWNIGPMIGPCLGPVVGGVLADKLGWRSIFWFLAISSGICAVVMILLIPETLRAMCGNGSVPPPKAYMPLIPIIGPKAQEPDYSSRGARRGFANPLLLFLYPDVTLLLLLNALVYSEFYAVTATISTLFQTTYPFLNQTDIGLCFLAIGGGMLVGGVVIGKLLDADYQRVKRTTLRRLEQEKVPTEDLIKEEHFPFEYARLRTMPAYLAIFVIASIGYGWCLHAKVSLAGPLVLQIIIGWVTVSMMNSAQTLIIDLAPEHGSAITACNNLVRCSFGAAFVSVIDLILKRLGTGWTYVLLSGICVVFSPIYWILMKYGPKWRAARTCSTSSCRR
ncbi:major facilitator superfamily domain-containing protein [Ganoderma leucocontextum]|nr:major facilitator superfamily domain-containing protein [Ganoderma leucocontextum]